MPRVPIKIDICDRATKSPASKTEIRISKNAKGSLKGQSQIGTSVCWLTAPSVRSTVKVNNYLISRPVDYHDKNGTHLRSNPNKVKVQVFYANCNCRRPCGATQSHRHGRGKWRRTTTHPRPLRTRNGIPPWSLGRDDRQNARQSRSKPAHSGDRPPGPRHLRSARRRRLQPRRLRHRHHRRPRRPEHPPSSPCRAQLRGPRRSRHRRLRANAGDAPRSRRSAR